MDLTEADIKVRLTARTLLKSKIDSHLNEESRMLYQFDRVRCDDIVRAVLRRLRANRLCSNDNDQVIGRLQRTDHG